MQSWAQDPPGIDAQATFEQVKAWRVANPEVSKSERAQALASWMDGNNWQSLGVNDQFELFDGLSADKINLRAMSARWTGSLQAPAAGNYTFRQIRQYSGNDSVMQVWISGNLVLDSGNGTGDERFSSNAIRLDTKPVEVRIELVHQVDHDPGAYSTGVPFAALTWESDSGLAKELIPAAAFSPPTGFGEAESSGLKGEYFAGTELGDSPVETRQDPGVQFTWSWEPVVGEERGKQLAILGQCRPKLLSGQFWRDIPNATEREEVMDSAGWRFSHYFTLEERRQYIELLTASPDVLRSLSPYALGKLTESIYMLPGKEHLDLIDAWCDANEWWQFTFLPLRRSINGFNSS